MQLNMTPRSAEKKRESKRIRRAGGIPAVVYGKNQEALTITVPESTFKAALRALPKGGLPTAVFTLVDEKGKEQNAVVKDIQYHPTTYDILHLDFEALQKGVEVTLKVPVELTKTVDCVGVKQGGVLRQVIRHVLVRCLPENIPTSFQLNVSKLSMKDYLRLSDIAIPDAVQLVEKTDEVVVVVAKR